MGKTIRGARKGKNSIFTAHTRLRKGPVRLRKIDYAEKEGYVKGVVKAIVHESGRGAPIAKVQFQNAYRYQRDTELFVAAEGMHEGAFVYCGAKAQLAVGNVLPLKAIPEGTVVCNVEAKLGDRGAFARCSGDYAVVVTHDEEKGTTKLRLPSRGDGQSCASESGAQLYGNWVPNHHNLDSVHGQVGCCWRGCGRILHR
jgi:large subunit ribosomal protein L8e